MGKGYSDIMSTLQSFLSENMRIRTRFIIVSRHLVVRNRCDPSVVLSQETSEVKDNTLMLLFNNAIDVVSYDDAYMALTRLTSYPT